MSGIKHNGVTVSIQRLSKNKLPALLVQIDGDNAIYKAATFTSEDSAVWFAEVMEDFFEGLVSRAVEAPAPTAEGEQK